MIRIITDSTSDLSIGEAQNLKVDLVYMKLNFGGTTYLDVKNISHEEFYEKLANSEEMPTTSLVCPQEFISLFKQYPDDEIIAILVGSKLSGTFQSAVIAKQELSNQKITIIDSETTTAGLNLLVKNACEFRDAGWSASDIAERINSLKKRLKVFAVVDTLKYLVKGGRLSTAAGMVGGILCIKPLVEINEGVVENVGKVRGIKPGISEIVKRINQERDETLPMLALYSYDRINLDSLFEALGENLDYCSIGAAIGAHVGPGAVGIAYYQK